MRLATLVAILTCATACSSDAPAPFADDDADDYEQDVDLGCARVFHQDLLPEYRVTISPEHWAALEDEFFNRVERESAGLDIHPYHPIEFEYDGEVITHATIRLKGQSSWLQAIAFDEHPKMQFVIAFNKVDPDGRFMGMRKLELDMPRNDGSFLRQRLGLYYLRAAGMDAQCANNARLVINGEYYGLYTNLERLDKEFIQRVYGKEDDEGNLWKGGRYIETNEETFTWDRLDAFWEVTNADELSELVDLETSVRVWASEAVAPHGDGYYNGRANYFLYDHPTRGFVWISHDLDAAFDFLPAEMSPMFPTCDGRWIHDRTHWSIVMADDTWQTAYEDAIRAQISEYRADALSHRVGEWAAQIAESAADDPMKPFSVQTHFVSVDSLQGYPHDRREAVSDWLDCRAQGGPDRDGDGFDECHDCNDSDASIHPGAQEICNGEDDNCDGRADEPTEGMTCE